MAIPLTGTDARSTVQLAIRAEDDRPVVRQFGKIATTMIDTSPPPPDRHPVDATWQADQRAR